MKSAGKTNMGTIRRPFLLLIPIVVICIVASSACIHDKGRTFVRSFDDLPGETLTAESFHFDPEGMAEVVSIETDASGIPVVTFAVGRDSAGWGQVVVSGENSGTAFVMEARDGVLIVDGIDFSGWEAVFASIIAIVGSIFVLCLVSFIRLVRRAWFGYEMAVYAGMALFFGVQEASFIVGALSGTITEFGELAYAITTMADNFVFVSLVPLFVLALLVSASNIVLMKRLGKRPSFMLGIVVSLVWAGACLAWWLVATASPETFEHLVACLFIDSMIAAAISFAVCLLAGVALAALLAARHRPTMPCDHVIILGCRVAPDGRPMTLLESRLDAALAFARRQEEGGFAAPVFVPSGGQGADEPCSEAESMRRYLEEHEVDPARILLEDKSTNTRQNMSFSAQVIRESLREASQVDGLAGGEGNSAAQTLSHVGFSTSNYHVLRGYVNARRAGMEAEGIAAPTSLCYWPNAFLREFVGMVATRAVPIVVTLVAIEALYVLAEYTLLLS